MIKRKKRVDKVRHHSKGSIEVKGQDEKESQRLPEFFNYEKNPEKLRIVPSK